ncbi:Uncharacterised protein [Bordetella pertussis]|nr:Uncharacterised protein [Bordetella pertussis]
MRPSATASSATSVMLLPGLSVPAGAGLLMATNHWSVSMGSSTTPVRSPLGCIILCGSTFTRYCCACSSATTAWRAS